MKKSEISKIAKTSISDKNSLMGPNFRVKIEEK
jgi:hypothetical protein